MCIQNFYYFEPKMDREALEEYMKKHQPTSLMDSIEKYNELHAHFNSGNRKFRTIGFENHNEPFLIFVN